MSPQLVIERDQLISLRFHFSLQKILDWRRTQLELEEAKFRQAMEAVAAVDRARAELEAAAVTAELEVRRWTQSPAAISTLFGDYRLHVRSQEQALAARRVECARRPRPSRRRCWRLAGGAAFWSGSASGGWPSGKRRRIVSWMRSLRNPTWRNGARLRPGACPPCPPIMKCMTPDTLVETALPPCR